MSQQVLKANLVLASDNKKHEDPELSYLRKEVGGYAVTSSRPPKSLVSDKDFTRNPYIRKSAVLSKSNSKVEPKAVVIHNRYLSKDEWRQIFLDYNATGYYNENFLSVVITQFVLQINPVDGLKGSARSNVMLWESKDWHRSPLLQSLIDYIIREEDGYSVPETALTVYSKACLDRLDPQRVVDIFRKVKHRTEVHNVHYLQLVVSAFHPHIGPDYEDCKKWIFPYMKSFHKLSPTDLQLVSALAIAAFRHNDLEVALPLLSHNTKKSFKDLPVLNDPILQPFLQCMSYCDDPTTWSERKKVVESYLNDRCKRNHCFTADHIGHVADWFKQIKSENWTPHWLTHNDVMCKQGFCPITGKELITTNLQEHESDYLKEIIAQVLMELVHGKSNPYALKKLRNMKEEDSERGILKMSFITVRFLEFIMEHGPFDAVIDGLNVVLGTNATSNTPGLKLLYNGIKFMKRKRKNMKIFLPLPYSMQPHIEQHVNDLNNVTSIMYFKSRKIMDDSLLLYAAMVGNDDCLLISMDKFRDFAFYVKSSLGDEAASLFFKFQRNRQTYISPFGKVAKPLGTAHTVVKGESSWNFGYYQNVAEYSKAKYPTRWLCMRKT
uniref:Mitochondrial ribonuclease P catalytic subunit n=1 Tax=Ciona intestinalis TaxID=7719 RepID=F6YG96_CIOIN|nr:mitochondrial ribonuclease P catalytic subunit [Ciona intestinalis]|eukprot:XP_002125581.1 mitochondrial ribonuclease P catalytic subunit [Ciona intestinalis]